MIKEIIEKYLDKTSILEKASKELGDRTKYIGSSDIGNCPRKVYLMKKEYKPTLSDLVKFARGHAFEPIIAEVFQLAGYKYEPQKEIVHPKYDYVQAHIDYFFHNKDMTKIRVVELKTVSTTPESAYPSWVDQVQYQLGTVKAVYPNAEIKGSILVVNVANGDIVEFNGMEPIDSVYKNLLQRAELLIDAIRNDEEPEPEIGFHCAWCPFRENCPAFTENDIDLPEDVVEEIKAYSELNEQKREIEAKIKEKRSELINVLGVGYKGSVSGYKVSVSQVETERLDTRALKENAPEVYDQYKKTLKYVKLDVKTSL